MKRNRKPQRLTQVQQLHEGRTNAGAVDLATVRVVADLVPEPSMASVATLRAVRDRLIERCRDEAEATAIRKRPLRADLAIPEIDLGEYGTMQRLPWYRGDADHYRAARAAWAKAREPDHPDDMKEAAEDGPQLHGEQAVDQPALDPAAPASDRPGAALAPDGQGGRGGR